MEQYVGLDARSDLVLIFLETTLLVISVPLYDNRKMSGSP